jgi:CDP-paratose 2-epimerase
MKESLLITGGAGFVGSNLAMLFKKDYPGLKIIALDNLRRRGSELNLPKLKAAGIDFRHGDIRNPSDLDDIGGFDLLIDCAAEPSVLSGYGTAPAYMNQTNLCGSLNCFEQARRCRADVVFISTNRVYPINPLRQLNLTETETRFQLEGPFHHPGITHMGVSEAFPMEGFRSFYGATKLASELMLAEYCDYYRINAITNRCGILTGPWQMGAIEQGVVALWVARHLFGGPLAYIGYGGRGKQVRDILHIEDFYDLLILQLNDPVKFSGCVFNVGGGHQNSVSLLELTQLCQDITGKQIAIEREPQTGPVDIPWYVSDYSKINALAQWRPKISVQEMIEQISAWMKAYQAELQPIFNTSQTGTEERNW